MYMNIGNAVMIRQESIIGIFDLDAAGVGGATMEYLKKCEKGGALVTVGDGIPKAFIVTSGSGSNVTYITTLSARSLWQRLEKR